MTDNDTMTHSSDMSDFDFDTRLWRYISFDKFLDLIRTEELYFASASEFDDTWEMYPPKAFLDTKEWENVFQTYNIKAMKENVDLSLLAQNTIGFFSYIYHYRDREYSFSCWSQQKSESAAFWDIYTDKKSAVAISTTPRKISESYRPDTSAPHSGLMMFPIEYIDYERFKIEQRVLPVFHINKKQIKPAKPSSVVTMPFRYKKEMYRYEEEIRLSFFSDQHQKATNRIKFDPNCLIQDVIVAPLANKSFFQHVKSLCDEYLPNCQVSRSALVPPDSLDCESYKEKFEASVRIQNERRQDKKYIIFENIDDFNEWHRNVCKALGIPRLGRNGESGALAFDKCPTTKWIEPTYHPDKTIRRVCVQATESIRFGHTLRDCADIEAQGWSSSK